MGYAIWHIHNRISAHAGGGGEHPTLSLHKETIKKLKENVERLSDTNATDLNLLQFQGLSNPLDIDEIEDIPAEEMSLTIKLEDEGLSDAIEEVLKTLSAREAGVIKLRFGLEDDIPRTLDEIAQVYGVTKERVRQIGSRAISQLRQPMRRNVLAAWTETSTEEEKKDSPLPQRLGSLASWQAFKGDDWDDPVRTTPEVSAYTDDEVISKITEIISTCAISAFRHPQLEIARSIYPAGLISEIQKALGNSIKPEHIVSIWDNSLLDIIARAKEQVGDDFSLDRVSQTFSKLLAECMHDEETIELTIPETLEGKLNFMGAWLRAGHLKISGNVGSHVGMSSNGNSQLTVQGDAGNFAGYGAHDFASITIMGDAADYLGGAARGSTSISVMGSVGNYCGYALSSKSAHIMVKGNAGMAVGHQARYGTIEIQGYAETVAPPIYFKGKIESLANLSL